MTDVDDATEVVTPPTGLRFAYRFFGWRIEEPYRAWLLADLADPTWMRRYRLRHLAFVAGSALLIFSVIKLRYGRVPLAGLGGFLGSAAGPFLFPGRVRQQVARRQLLPGEETTWWHRLSNVTWTSINVTVLVVFSAAIVIGFEAVERNARKADSTTRVACTVPSPEITLAVVEAFGSSEVYRPTAQVDGPGDAVLVRVGPPVSLYAAVRRRDDATLEVLPVQLSSPGIYEEAIDNLDSCT